MADGGPNIDLEEDEPRPWDLSTRLSRRQLLWETAAVLCLAVLPAWIYGLGSLIWPDSVVPSFWEDFWYSLASSIQVCAPVLYFIGRSGERWSHFGLARPRWVLDSLGGIAVWMVKLVLIASLIRMLDTLLDRDQIEALTALRDCPFSVPHSAAQWAALVVFIAASAFAEELVMRGYLIRRFEQLLHSTWLSVLITTVLFAGYHCYQGPGGVVDAAASGFVYAVAFCLFRRLWPVVIAHTLHNLAAYL
ncbi:MAG TPA: type II CAAX endopeptidase family protein [Pirellulales bacterium]|nr:type II CAAX endopeptidase family protein [Pirellulales bacterium]